MNSVFISHTTSLEQKAALLTEKLRKEDVTVFTPSEFLTINAESHAEILANIRRCSLFVALVDDLSPNVMFELGYALATADSVLLVAEPDAHIPFDIASLPVIRFDNSESYIAYKIIEHLKTSIRKNASSSKDLNEKNNNINLEYHSGNIEDLSPLEFESIISKYFDQKGFLVERPTNIFEPSCDLILWDKNKESKTLVEIKKYAKSGKIGVASVRQLLSNMMLSDATVGLLITSGDFSASAIDMAKKSPLSIILLSFNKLISSKEDDFKLWFKSKEETKAN